MKLLNLHFIPKLNFYSGFETSNIYSYGHHGKEKFTVRIENKDAWIIFDIATMKNQYEMNLESVNMKKPFMLIDFDTKKSSDTKRCQDVSN